MVFSGVEDYLQEIDTDIWVYGMAYESAEAPPFYSDQFEANANRVLVQNFGINREGITTSMCKLVYVFLINNM